ncbi:MAG TPA: hypothetical protein VMM76_01635 [Pirellulaceae bacterium]|nr:hypothetical protein [Pirellulaceae bacterium]
MHISWFTVEITVAMLFLVGIVAAGLWERRPVQPYRVPAAGSEYLPTQTAISENSAAEELGYTHGGLAHDGKGRLYRVRYDFWIAPDYSTLAVVGGGTVASIPVDGVWLWSRSTDGQILCTTNETGEQDVSGVVQQETWPNVSFANLADRHTQRVRNIAVNPLPEQEPMLGYFEVRQAVADALVQRGYAYYITDERQVWRYTVKGAFAFYVAAKWLRPIGRFLRSAGI